MAEACAFMSYARRDDESARGQLTRFREDLSDEIEMQTGVPFHVFQDRESLEWGQQWLVRIKEALDGASFLIAVITPRFFQSEACRGELLQFARRETTLARGDLILPLLFVDAEVLRAPGEIEPAVAEAARVVNDHQYVDWRDFRDVPLRSPRPRKALKQLAKQIVSALNRPSAVGDDPERARDATVIAFPSTLTVPAPAHAVAQRYEGLVRALHESYFDRGDGTTFALATADLIHEIDLMPCVNSDGEHEVNALITSLGATIRDAAGASSLAEFRAAAARAERIRGWILDALQP